MAGVTITLPEDLSDWAEAQAAAENRESVTAYVRDLLERERVKQQKIAAMQEKVDEGLASGFSDKSLDQIWAEARKRAGVPQ